MFAFGFETILKESNPDTETTRGKNLNRGIFFFQYCFILPPLRFHCVGGCWDRTQDCCVRLRHCKGKEERNLPSRPCHRQHHRSSCSAAHPGWLTGPSGAQAPDSQNIVFFKLRLHKQKLSYQCSGSWIICMDPYLDLDFNCVVTS